MIRKRERRGNITQNPSLTLIVDVPVVAGDREGDDALELSPGPVVPRTELPSPADDSLQHPRLD